MSPGPDQVAHSRERKPPPLALEAAARGHTPGGRRLSAGWPRLTSVSTGLNEPDQVSPGTRAQQEAQWASD